MKTQLKKIELNSMRLATASIAVSSGIPPLHPDKKSVPTIVREIKIEHGSDISGKSETMMFLQGRIGASPKTRGPNKNIPFQVWNLTKGAFVSFLKLEQASDATQSTMKKLSLRTKNCLNKGGYKQTDLNYVRKLRKETSDKMEIGVKNFLARI